MKYSMSNVPFFHHIFLNKRFIYFWRVNISVVYKIAAVFLYDDQHLCSAVVAFLSLDTFSTLRLVRSIHSWVVPFNIKHLVDFLLVLFVSNVLCLFLVHWAQFGCFTIRNKILNESPQTKFIIFLSFFLFFLSSLCVLCLGAERGGGMPNNNYRFSVLLNRTFRFITEFFPFFIIFFRLFFLLHFVFFFSFSILFYSSSLFFLL